MDSSAGEYLEVDGIRYFNPSSTDLTVYVTSGVSYSGDIIIPEKVEYEGNEYSVTGIGPSAFKNSSWLTSVIIPNSVISIDNYAFSGCTRLTSVSIPNSIERIGAQAFYNCYSLTSVTIPNSVTRIDSEAFLGCSDLKKVIVEDLTAWCNISFNNWDANPLNLAHHLYSDENTEITDLVIPNNVTTISGYAFFGCTGLTSVTINNGVTTIGMRAFYGCSGLTSVTIPNSVTGIGYGAFSECI